MLSSQSHPKTIPMSSPNHPKSSQNNLKIRRPSVGRVRPAKAEGGGFLPPTPLRPGGLQPTPRRVSFKGRKISQNPRRVSFKAKNACHAKLSWTLFGVICGDLKMGSKLVVRGCLNRAPSSGHLNAPEVLSKGSPGAENARKVLLKGSFRAKNARKVLLKESMLLIRNSIPLGMGFLSEWLSFRNGFPFGMASELRGGVRRVSLTKAWVF